MCRIVIYLRSFFYRVIIQCSVTDQSQVGRGVFQLDMDGLVEFHRNCSISDQSHVGRGGFCIMVSSGAICIGLFKTVSDPYCLVSWIFKDLWYLTVFC